MADLTYLNEAAVLHNLRQRYYHKLIYVSKTKEHLFTFLLYPVGKEFQKGSRLTSESAKVRKSRGYVQLDISQRRFCFA